MGKQTYIVISSSSASSSATTAPTSTASAPTSAASAPTSATSAPASGSTTPTSCTRLWWLRGCGGGGDCPTLLHCFSHSGGSGRSCRPEIDPFLDWPTLVIGVDNVQNTVRLSCLTRYFVIVISCTWKWLSERRVNLHVNFLVFKLHFRLLA